MDNQPKLKRETKNTIRVEFNRTPLADRLKAKYLNTFFYKKILMALFRFLLLLGLSFIILFPFFSWISSSFMSPADFTQPDVNMIPKYPTVQIYKYLAKEAGYFKAIGNTLLLCIISAGLQTFVCAIVGYGFAKFKFKGRGALFALVLFTMVIPHEVLRLPMFLHYRWFKLFGFIDLSGLLTKMGLDYGLINTFVPFILLSLTGLAFKNGLFIFLMRQFYRGVPDELEESAYVDGSGVVKTYFRIILPISIPMMITIFLLAFSWQWTDTFYTELFYTESASTVFMNDFVYTGSQTLTELSADAGAYSQSFMTAVTNTAGLMAVAPLILIYLFCQRYLIQGIEHSGFGGT